MAEMGSIAQEVTAEPASVTARLFTSESRRAVLAARSDDPVSVAVLVELARSLIHSPVPPPSGVDIVFFDEGADPPMPATVLQNVCDDRVAADSCTAERLGAAARGLMTSLKGVR